jgi:hypothetical protein
MRNCCAVDLDLCATLIGLPLVAWLWPSRKLEVVEGSAGLNGVKTLEIVGPDCDCFEYGSTIPRDHCSPISLVKATNRGSSRRLSKRGSTLM